VVKGCTYDSTIGGHYGDAAIANFMTEKFAKKFPEHAESVKSTSRTQRKLITQAKKTRHILSANKEAFFQRRDAA